MGLVYGAERLIFHWAATAKLYQVEGSFRLSNQQVFVRADGLDEPVLLCQKVGKLLLVRNNWRDKAFVVPSEGESLERVSQHILTYISRNMRSWIDLGWVINQHTLLEITPEVVAEFGLLEAIGGGL